MTVPGLPTAAQVGTAGQVGTVGGLALPAEPVALRELTAWVTALLVAADATALQGSAELAVHEVCMNVIDHAYGPGHVPNAGDIVVDGGFDGRSVTVRVRDTGVPCERGAGVGRAPEFPTVRGYGLVIVEKLAEELIYQRISDTNVWRIRFARPSRSSDQSVEHTS